MRKLNEEQFRRLQPYRDHLTRGFYGRYVYGLRRPVFDELYAIYKEMGFTKNLTYDCNGCIVDLTSTLGKYFFEYEEKLKEEQESQMEEENPDFTEEDLEKAADEINEAILKDMQNNADLEPKTKPVEQSTTEEPKEAEKPQKTAKKTNNTKTKKTNTRKKK